ncbi:DUF6978 family protein [Bombilactobacillus folatiphilus]|uniref:DUF6978 family protein n=1 Tax=Bombilactobacillus folatiphilus TaxID=2923362 RepID=UPI0037C03149
MVYLNRTDNTKVSGNHLHIYKLDSSEDNNHTYAYDLSKYGNFISTDSLEESFEKFISFINIKYERS